MAPINTRLLQVDRSALFGVVFLAPASIFLLMLLLKFAEMKLGFGVGGPYDTFHWVETSATVILIAIWAFLKFGYF